MDVENLLEFSHLPSLDLLEICDEEAHLFDSNGDEIEDTHLDFVHSWATRSFSRTRVCPHCLSSFHNGIYKHKADEIGPPGEALRRKVHVLSCQNCSYWQIDWLDKIPAGFHCEPGPSYLASQKVFIISKVSQFAAELPDGVHSELAIAIRRKQQHWHTLNPKTFEELVAAVFRANYKKCEAIHVGKPDDGGVDVIFIEEVSGKKWLIQCKCRQKEKSAEGISTLRNLLGAMRLMDSSFGIIVSTADHFTFRALQAVKRAHEVGCHIRLIDCGKLNRMLTPLIPDRPWLQVIKAIDPNASSRLAKRIPSHKQGCFDFIYEPKE